MLLAIIFVSIAFFLTTAFYFKSKLRQSKSTETKEECLLTMYKKAVCEARTPHRRPKARLHSIHDGNPHLEWKEIDGKRHVKMTTWKYQADCFKTDILTIGNWNIWVTIPSELKRFGEDFISKNPTATLEKTSLRIKQVLGLPYQNQYNYFVEFWVKPEDLVRPSHNPDVTHAHCEPIFHENTCPKHKKWIEELQQSIYVCEVDGQNLGYPWTQLGYTYDWCSESQNNIGLTEFCVKHDSTIHIEKIYSTEGYFQQFHPLENA